MIFRPAPPGDINAQGNSGLKLPKVTITIDATESEMALIINRLPFDLEKRVAEAYAKTPLINLELWK